MKLGLIKQFMILLFVIVTVSCSSSEQKKIVETNNNKSRALLLEQGTVQIACTVVELMEVNGQEICVAIIDTVFGYGAGARPIATDSQLDLSINKSLDKNIFQKDSKHRLTLKFTSEIFDGEVDFPWQIIMVQNK